MRFLRIPGHIRSDHDIDRFLCTQLNTNEFIQQLNLKTHQSRKLLRKLKYEYHPAGHNVVEYGTKGDCLYLIVKGRVGIWIPSNYK